MPKPQRLGLLATTLLLTAGFGCRHGTESQPRGTASPEPDSPVAGSGATDSSATAEQDASSSPAQQNASSASLGKSARAVFLHHSTGNNIWRGGVADWIDTYNGGHDTDYRIDERSYPSGEQFQQTHGWSNYPFDYWNIWVRHAGSSPYLDQDTLEILTQQYDVIVWKHCYPVSNIGADQGSADITSSAKTLQNYRAQYEALKTKMRAFPSTRFLVWTGAALTQATTTEAHATRARDFFSWVRQTWDEPGDNIFVWDFWQLETQGGLYLLEQNASGPTDSHPNSSFSSHAAPLFARRLVDVIEGRGDTASMTGQ